MTIYIILILSGVMLFLNLMLIVLSLTVYISFKEKDYIISIASLAGALILTGIILGFLQWAW